jgi:hypothetical protein
MLAVGERRDAVCGLAGLEEQRVTLAADRRRLERHHGAQTQRPGPERTARHGHPHVVAQELLVAARAALVVDDRVRIAVEHEPPRPAHEMHARVPRGVRLPGGSRGLARHRIGTVHAGHRVLVHVHAGHIVVHG